MSSSKRFLVVVAVCATSLSAFAPSALAGHRYNVTTGNGSCQQLGGKSEAGTSDGGLDRAERNGRIQGGACPA